jgi:hypothetical protein
MFLSLGDEVTNVLCVSILSHDRYQYDSLIPSKQTWLYSRQHLQQLLQCQGRWRRADVTKECLKTIFVFPLRYYANRVSTTLTVLVTLKASISFIVTLYCYYSRILTAPLQSFLCSAIKLTKIWHRQCISKSKVFTGLKMADRRNM